MARGLDASQKSALADNNVTLALFVKLGLSTPIKVWSGVGDLTISSDTYVGVGDLGKVSPLSEDNTIGFKTVQLTLAGIPGNLLDAALDEDYENTTVDIYLGLFDSNGELISTLFNIFTGYSDTMSISVDGDSATITLVAANKLNVFERTKVSRYTNAEQQRLYSGDEGLEYLSGVIDQELEWG